MLLARLFFVLKIKTTIVTDCIFFVFDTRFFVVCWQDFFVCDKRFQSRVLIERL